MTKEAKIIIGIGTIVILGAVILGLNQSDPAEPSNSIDSIALLREGSHMTRTKEARVQIVEFGDYQCPACGAVHPAIKQLLTDYKDNANVNFVFRNFPLPMHRNALIAAEAAEASGAQGKFWEMHDKLYENQNEWAEKSDSLELFINYAQSLGLNIEKFKADIQNHNFVNVIKADTNDGQSLGIPGTPTFFINGEQLSNIPNLQEFKNKIEATLK